MSVHGTIPQPVVRTRDRAAGGPVRGGTDVAYLAQCALWAAHAPASCHHRAGGDQ